MFWNLIVFVATASSSGQEGQHAGPSSLPSCLHQRSGRAGHTSSTFHFPSAVNFIQCRLDFPSQPFECPLLASPIQPQYSRPNMDESDQALVLSTQHRHYTMVAPWSSNIFSSFARSTRPVCRHAFLLLVPVLTASSQCHHQESSASPVSTCLALSVNRSPSR